MSPNSRENVAGDTSTSEAAAENLRLEQKLFAYALAASIGAILLPSEAAAKIVYNATYARTTDPSHIISIDLDHNGIKDFDVYRSIFLNSNGVDSFRVKPSVSGNQILSTSPYGWPRAAAVGPGAYIGQGARFSANASLMTWSYKCKDSYHGPWAYARGRYLGFAFLIRGSVHYGWARISIGPCGAATTGYAYETIPNRPIQAGQTQSNDDIASLTPQTLVPDGNSMLKPATLGLLAQGASGVVAWRREDDLLPPDV